MKTRPLGTSQKSFLWTLYREKGWYQGAGWLWGSTHASILESLMKRGLVSAEEKDIPAPRHSFGYDPEKHGRVWTVRLYTITEDGLKAIEDRIAHAAAVSEKRRLEDEKARAAAEQAQKDRDETRAAIEAVRDRLRSQMSNFEIEALCRAVEKFR
jgi:hypothetical protein